MYFNTTKKVIRIVNKNIIKIFNLYFDLYQQFFLCSNILQFKDLINYTNILFMNMVLLMKCQSRISLLFLNIYLKILT